jgi:hypothetical protein
MNRKYLLLLASLSFAAVTACSNNGTSDGGTTTSAASSSGSSSGGVTTTTTHSASSGSASGSTSGGSSSSGGTTTVPSSSGGSSGGSTGSSFPAVPVLGGQIDRVGRPAINTALTDPYNLLVVPPDGGITEDTAKNTYNSAAGGIPQWTAPDGGGFIPWIAQNLAIADSLDGICGNQAFAGLPDSGVTAYGTLATVLADDELYIDTTQTTCSFLGAELEQTGLATNNCGGRQPTEDVIDIEYNILAVGFAGLPTADAGFAIVNGAESKQACSNPANDDTAPYLGAPNTQDGGGACVDGGY